VRRLVGRFEPDAPALQVWPIILAAGKGEQARESGLQVPKPLAPVLGVPAVLRVLLLGVGWDWAVREHPQESHNPPG